MTRRTALTAAVVAGLALTGVGGSVALSETRPAQAADHLDAPTVRADHRVDISDLYVFHSQNNRHSVLTIDVNALTTPADTASTRFAPDALYQFHVDTNGDAIEDFAYQFSFGQPRPDGTQSLTVSRATGKQAREHRLGSPIGRGNTSTGNTVACVGLRDGARAYAGPRDDPFFFDLAGAANNFQFTGTDTFAGTNVSTIVLEIPDSWLPGQVRVWASTARPGTDGRMAQVDRAGNPAINNLFNHTDTDTERFNLGVPSHDVADWTQTVINTVTFFGQSVEYGQQVAARLLPDVLTYDPGNPASFPNGRSLTDDVIDATLSLVTHGYVTTDSVDHNDAPFLTSFPYLAAAH